MSRPNARERSLVSCFILHPALLGFALIASLQAQDHTVLFGVGDAGVRKAITNWGLDTCWPSYDNMQRGLIFMGTNNVNIVRVGFVVDAPLTNNDFSTSQKATLQTMANLPAMAGPNARWDINHASGVDPWYQRGNDTVYPDRWAASLDDPRAKGPPECVRRP